LRGDLQIEIHRSNHQAQAQGRLIGTRDRPFCKTPSLKSPMSFALGTDSVRRKAASFKRGCGTSAPHFKLEQLKLALMRDTPPRVAL